MIRARYEDLRADVLRHDSNAFVHSRGLAIFVRSGMLGWMDAWLQCKSLNRHPENNSDNIVRHELPLDVRSQLVLVLANMAIRTREEVRL